MATRTRQSDRARVARSSVGAATKRPARRRIALLAGGALIGLLIAGTDLVTDWSSASGKLPPGAIARIGNQLITQAEFERVAQDLATDKRTKGDEDRNFALKRIIEEELLVQRGIELGFPETAPGIRKALAAAVITQVITEAEALAPSSEELRAFYDGDANFFTQTERLQVRWLRTTGTVPTMEQKQAVHGSLISTCHINDMTQPMNFDVVSELPNKLLPLTKLMDYMGPTLARQATQIQPGECSEPILINGTYHVLYLEAYQPRQLPEFNDIKHVIETEYIRRAGEKALLDYLKWLRNRAEIIIDEAKLE